MRTAGFTPEDQGGPQAIVAAACFAGIVLLCSSAALGLPQRVAEWLGRFM